jgi:hypothetical protein
MPADKPQALSIGIIVDSTASDGPSDTAARHLTRQVMLAAVGVHSPLNLNVVFQLPGEWVAPDFVGVRTGRFNASRSLLMVQAAVPKEPTDDPDSMLLSLLAMAVDRAEAYARRKKIAPELAELHAIVDRLGIEPHPTAD